MTERHPPRPPHRPLGRFERNYQRSRVMLFSLLVLTFPVVASVAGAVESTRRLILVLLGFSGIIFVHELGHFLVARMCSVRCDVFSIGIGPRMLGWKKGLGLSFGKSPEERDAHEKHEDETAKGAGRGTVTFGDLEQTASAPAVVSGETDYRISWLPLGGYVRMLGQDDMDPTKQSSDPRSFGRRPIWQRMCIVSAGVIMNMITALVIFSVIFQPNIGVKFPPGIVGDVVYNSPAANAGLQMGDKVVEINDSKDAGFLEFTDIMIASALAKKTDEIKFKVERPGADKPLEFKIRPIETPSQRFMVIGVGPMPSNTVATMSAEEWESLKKMAAENKTSPNIGLFAPGDEIVAADGKRFELSTDERKSFPYLQLHEALQKSQGKAVTLTVKKAGSGVEKTVEITPELNGLDSFGEAPGLLGLNPRVVVRAVVEKSAAEKAGVKVGDVVAAIGAEGECPSVKEFRADIEKSAGREIAFTVLRENDLHEIKPVSLPITPKKDKDGKAKIGVMPDLDLKGPVVVTTTEDARLATLPRGATINKINGHAVASWADVFTLGRTLGRDDTIRLEYTDALGRPGSLEVKLAGTTEKCDPLVASVAAPVTAYEFRLGVPVDNVMWTQAATPTGGSGEAMVMGFQHTRKFMVQTYMTLAGLFRGTVSAKELHGIVGIAKVGHDVQDRGITHLWFIMAVVSVNLAVANFLPLPIVDGGLFLLLILEKIRGKPLSLKVQSAIQMVGIVALAGLFLFVTFNDIIFVGGWK